jgi:hypothetical protein
MEARRLALESQRIITLPDSFRVTAGAILGNASFVLIGPGRGDLLLCDSSGAHRVVSGPATVPQSVWATDSAGDFAVIDSTAGQLKTYTHTGQFQAAIPFATSPRILAIAHVGRYILVTRAGGQPKSLQIEEYPALGEAPRQVRHLHIPTAIAADSYWVTVAGRRVLFARLDRPYTAYSVDVVSSKVDTIFASPREAGFPLKADTLRWIGLRALVLDAGFIRTFADLDSDDRILTVANAHGKITRTTKLNAPIAFIASDPELQLLLAIRSLNGSDAILYNWHWLSAEAAAVAAAPAAPR